MCALLPVAAGGHNTTLRLRLSGGGEFSSRKGLQSSAFRVGVWGVGAGSPNRLRAGERHQASGQTDWLVASSSRVYTRSVVLWNVERTSISVTRPDPVMPPAGLNSHDGVQWKMKIKKQTNKETGFQPQCEGSEKTFFHFCSSALSISWKCATLRPSAQSLPSPSWRFSTCCICFIFCLMVNIFTKSCGLYTNQCRHGLYINCTFICVCVYKQDLHNGQKHPSPGFRKEAFTHFKDQVVICSSSDQRQLAADFRHFSRQTRPNLEEISRFTPFTRGRGRRGSRGVGGRLGFPTQPERSIGECRCFFSL